MSDDKNYYSGQVVYTYKEIKKAALLSKKMKSYLPSSVLKTVFAVLVIILFTQNALSAPKNITNYFVLAIGVAVIIYAWTFPRINEKKSVMSAVTGNTVTFKVYADRVEVETLQIPGSRFEVKLDRECFITKAEDMAVVHMQNGQILIIPDRAFDPADKSSAFKRIYQGTRLKADK